MDLSALVDQKKKHPPTCQANPTSPFQNEPCFNTQGRQTRVLKKDPDERNPHARSILMDKMAQKAKQTTGTTRANQNQVDKSELSQIAKSGRLGDQTELQ